jgi:hypothetical protein
MIRCPLDPLCRGTSCRGRGRAVHNSDRITSLVCRCFSLVHLSQSFRPRHQLTDLVTVRMSMMVVVVVFVIMVSDSNSGIR